MTRIRMTYVTSIQIAQSHLRVGISKTDVSGFMFMMLVDSLANSATTVKIEVS